MQLNASTLNAITVYTHVEVVKLSISFAIIVFACDCGKYI